MFLVLPSPLLSTLSVPGNLGEIDWRKSMKADVLKADEKTDRRKRLNSLEEHYRTQAICLAFFSNRDLLDKL